MHCALPGDYHGLSHTCIQFHSPKVKPLTTTAEVTDRGLSSSNSNTSGWYNSHQSGVILSKAALKSNCTILASCHPPIHFAVYERVAYTLCRLLHHRYPDLSESKLNHWDHRHGVAALDFATVSGCDQLVIGPTHARGGTLDLLMTDVPDLVWVAVVVPLGRYDHSITLDSHFDGTGYSELVF